MDDEFRTHITNNMDRLIELTNYDKLIRACVLHGLLTPKMREIIENMDPTCRAKLNQKEFERERHKRLFLKITKRGPGAYDTLKTIFSDLKWDGPIQVLNEARDDKNRDRSLHPQRKSSGHTTEVTAPLASIENRIALEDFRLSTASQDSDNDVDGIEEYVGPIKEQKYEVKKSDRIHADKVGVYTMKSKDNRGVLFLVNIIDFPQKDRRRNGAEQDTQALLYLYKKLKFKLFAYNNLNRRKFFDHLKKLLDSDIVRKTECFTMVLMSHGELNSEKREMVEFRDGEFVELDEIKECFQNQQCPNLVNKPKVLILPFCRGNIPDKGWSQPRLLTQTEGRGIMPPRNKPSLSHVLFCFASARGFMAHRHPDDGSWYIQTFCKRMASEAHDTHFEDIIKYVNQDTSEKRAENLGLQTGCTEAVGFDKKLFFNPGFYEENGIGATNME